MKYVLAAMDAIPWSNACVIIAGIIAGTVVLRGCF